MRDKMKRKICPKCKVELIADADGYRCPECFEEILVEG